MCIFAGDNAHASRTRRVAFAFVYFGRDHSGLWDRMPHRLLDRHRCSGMIDPMAMMPMEDDQMDSGKRINLADVMEGKQLHGPEFIKLTSEPISGDTIFADAARLTVADWRKAQLAAIDGEGVDGDGDPVDSDEDEHSLRQFRMATLVLVMAEEDGLPEDAIALPTLGCPRAVEVVGGNPDYMQGVDGIWRRRDNKPDLQLIQ